MKITSFPRDLNLFVILQDEVRNLIKMTLGEREREIIHLYYGLDNEYLTWEDISRRYLIQIQSIKETHIKK